MTFCELSNFVNVMGMGYADIEGTDLFTHLPGLIRTFAFCFQMSSI